MLYQCSCAKERIILLYSNCVRPAEKEITLNNSIVELQHRHRIEANSRSLVSEWRHNAQCLRFLQTAHHDEWYMWVPEPARRRARRASFHSPSVQAYQPRDRHQTPTYLRMISFLHRKNNVLDFKKWALWLPRFTLLLTQIFVSFNESVLSFSHNLPRQVGFCRNWFVWISQSDIKMFKTKQQFKIWPDLKFCKKRNLPQSIQRRLKS